MGLLNEYMVEISDPKNKKEYDDWLRQMESEGELPKHMQLVQPTAEFCVKTTLTSARNKQQEMKVLRPKLIEAEIEKQSQLVTQKIKLMVGSGDRSDMISTYNFPQNRLTDHRIGLTMYNLSQVMEGDLEELFEKLKIADRSEKLSEEQ